MRGTVALVRDIRGDEGFVRACVTGTEDAGTEGASVTWDDRECFVFPVDAAPTIGACIVVESRPHSDATFRSDYRCDP